MTAQTQNLLMGNNIGTATITPMTRGATGALTAGSSVSLLTVFENIQPKRFAELERASITASSYANNVQVESGTDYEITGWILKNDVYSSSATNQIGYLTDNFSYFQIVHVRGGVTWTYIGIIEGYEEIMSGKNAIKFTFTLKMVDIGGPNPVLS